MFHPETEDMLPRMAPKPSPDVTNGASDAIIRPQVPEVSILFGQQDADSQHHIYNATSQHKNKNYPQPTYAAWKKQMLPKVSYPASVNLAGMQENNAMMHDYNCPKTNLYPFRSNINPTLNGVSNSNVNAFGSNSGTSGVENQLTYRRSFDSCNKNVYKMQNLPVLQAQAPLGTMGHLPNITPGEVLTICAGTQTDSTLESSTSYSHNLSQLATKEDVENIREILNELKFEQQRMFKIMETILLSHHSQTLVETQFHDIGVQVDFIEIDNPPYVNNDDIGSIQDQQSAPTNKFLQHQKSTVNTLPTTKGKPIAQSTTYRVNSPQPLPINYQSSNKPSSMIPKSASDTSLAMNELALKYLPSEKLAELLQELNMDCPLNTVTTNAPATPDRLNMGKFEKGPSDISNASYKYLKKYRLLPEDYDGNINMFNNHRGEGTIENDNGNEIPQYSSPKYNTRNTPLNQKLTSIDRCSPYAGHLPLSPLARAPSPPLQSKVPSHIVNLDNIKQQPKFL